MSFLEGIFSGSRFQPHTEYLRGVFQVIFLKIFCLSGTPQNAPSPLRDNNTEAKKCISNSIWRRRKGLTESRGINPCSERTSLCSLSVLNIMQSLKGSITLEASIVMPLAIFFIFTIFSLFTVLSVQVKVQEVLEQSLEKISIASTAEMTILFDDENTHLLENVTDVAALETLVRTGMADLDNVSQITLLGTELDKESGQVKLVVTYKMILPTAMFPVPSVRMTQVGFRRLWTGAEADTGEENSGEVAYITEHGNVYHIYRDCRHLVQRTSTVNWEDLSTARANDGSIYYPCEYCHPSEGLNSYYIASYGNRYHSSRNCPQLRLTVRTVNISEVGDRPLCSTCASRSSQ